MALHLKRTAAAASLRMIRCQTGNVATMAAVTLPVCMAAMAFAVDEGALYFERRELQAATDIAAIVAAANMQKAELAARQAFADNAVVLTSFDEGGGGIESGEIGTDVRIVVTKGRYLADKATSRKARFQAGAGPHNAVKVTAMRARQALLRFQLQGAAGDVHHRHRARLCAGGIFRRLAAG